MPRKKILSTALFVLAIGAVLGLVAFLASQSTPPDLPASGPQHKLRLSRTGELVGVDSEPPLDLAAPLGEIDVKSVERRVNASCTACHGGLMVQEVVDPQTGKKKKGDTVPVDCPKLDTTPPTPCVPEHHPPKPECIKCHRAPSAR